MSGSRAGSRLPLNWYRDPRVVTLSDAAQALLTRLATYAADELTDGNVPSAIVLQQTSHLGRGAAAVIRELVAGGWAELRSSNDLHLVGWEVFNLPRSTVEAIAAQRTATSAAGGRARQATAERDVGGRFSRNPGADPAGGPAGRPAVRLDGRQPAVQPDASTVPVPVPGGTSAKYLRGEGWGDLSGTEFEAFRRKWHERWRQPPTASQLRSLAPIVRDWPKESAVWLSECQGTKTFGAVEHVFRRFDDERAAREELSRQSDADWNAAKAEARTQAPRAMERVIDVVKRVAPRTWVTETGDS